MKGGRDFISICSSVGRRCDLSMPTFARLQDDTNKTLKERTKPLGRKGRQRRANEETKKRETKTEAKKEREYRRHEATKQERKGNTNKQEHANMKMINGGQHERGTYEETNDFKRENMKTDTRINGDETRRRNADTSERRQDGTGNTHRAERLDTMRNEKTRSGEMEKRRTLRRKRD